MATSYIPRNKALKKLQLSLPDFRRLCILKGIYPHEPKNLKKVNHGSTARRTFYYTKDIQFLAHEPLLEKFRDFKAFMRKVKRAFHKDQKHTVERLYENRPVYTVDHIVRERYPSFTDALRDIDDALCMLFLFSTLPQYRRLQAYVVHNCKRLTTEFMHYIIESRSLRKVFLSIKGIYYQAEVMGQTITWIIPYQFSTQMPSDVDFRVMLTFVEFYATLMGFINFRLYHSLNLKYPPQIEGLPPPPAAEALSSQIPEPDVVLGEELEDHTELLASLGQSLARVVTEDVEEAIEEEIPLDLSPEEQEAQQRAREEEAKLERLKRLFQDCKVFLSREVPREALTFVIRSLGGSVSWDPGAVQGASFPESDETITHQVMDRPSQKHRFLSRDYVQPQWVFDSVNVRRLLPVGDYAPGSALPPHLSPFVEEEEGDYVPPERERQRMEEQAMDTAEVSASVEEGSLRLELEDLRRGEGHSSRIVVGTVHEGLPMEEQKKEGQVERDHREKREEKRLAIMMMSRKRRRLYEQILKSRRKKAAEVKQLKRKRREHETLTSKKAKIS